MEIAPLVARGTVTGIDLEEGALALARHKASQGDVRNASFRKGDACALDFPANSFDAVAANQLFGDQGKIVAEAARVLKPGGILAMAEIIGADPADRDSLTVAFYEYFRIGRYLLDAKYGGALTTSVLIAVGQKD